MTAQESIDAIERDRKRRERELLLLLLLIAGGSKESPGLTLRYAVHAVKLGGSPLDAMRQVWLGSGHFRGIVTPLARVMADSHVTGYLRAARMVGTEAPAPDASELVRYYTPRAQHQASQMLETLSQRVSGDLAGIYDGKQQILTIRKSFADGGYTVENPTALERGATEAVLTSYQDGYGGGMKLAADTGAITGFKYIATIDDRTTAICRSYNGTKLPADHWWWKGHAPPCHFNCRSVYLPIRGEFDETIVPTIQPMPGFGFDATGPLTPYAESAAA